MKTIDWAPTPSVVPWVNSIRYWVVVDGDVVGRRRERVVVVERGEHRGRRAVASPPSRLHDVLLGVDGDLVRRLSLPTASFCSTSHLGHVLDLQERDVVDRAGGVTEKILRDAVPGERQVGHRSGLHGRDGQGARRRVVVRVVDDDVPAGPPLLDPQAGRQRAHERQGQEQREEQRQNLDGGWVDLMRRI